MPGEGGPTGLGEGRLLAGLGLLLIALLAGALAFRARRRKRTQWAAPLAAFTLIAGGWLTLQGIRTIVLANVRNPFPATAVSIDRGQEIYMEYCASCHGITGRADGPVGLTLVPRPPDLRAHLGAHTDGELFDWVSNGVPGTPMPAFRDVLTEEDRWHVMNFVRGAYGPSRPPAS